MLGFALLNPTYGSWPLNLEPISSIPFSALKFLIIAMTNSLKEFLKRRVKRPGINLYWKIYGKTLRNPPVPKDPKSILFICKGNICRSPYAEYASPRLLKGSPWQELRVSSAGLAVPISEKSPADALATAGRLGVDMNAHISRPLTRELVEENDIILAMEAWQVRKMKKQYPKHSQKFFLLPLFDSVRTGKADAVSQLQYRGSLR